MELDAVTQDTDSPTWYLDFEAWWTMQHYDAQYLYIFETESWVRYDTGVFKPYPLPELERVIIDYLDGHDLVRSATKLNLAVRSLQGIQGRHLAQFDADPAAICVLNGIVVLDGVRYTPDGEEPVRVQLISHRAERLFLIQLQVEFHADPAPTPYWDKVRGSYFYELFRLERFVQAVIRRDVDNELMCWIYGPTNSGKGTVLNVVDAIFGDAVAHKPVEKLGDAFGLSGLIGKLLNLVKEGNITWLNSETVRWLKTIVGKDGRQEINIKRIPQFEYCFSHLFFITASNQLPRLPSTDVKAWFRRCWLIAFDHTQRADPAMKTAILAEASDIFSELLLLPYTPLRPRDIEAFWQANKATWEGSSDPVRRIVSQHFRRSDDGIEKLQAQDVVTYVEEQMLAEGYGLPSHQYLTAAVTNTLAGLHVGKVRSHNLLYYCPLACRDHEIASPDLDEEDRSPAPLDRLFSQ
jgi:phage/plasmid-associated DNA primase